MQHEIFLKIGHWERRKIASCFDMTCQTITPIHVKNCILRAKSSFFFASKGSKSISKLHRDRDQNIVDPDPYNVCTKYKWRAVSEENSSTVVNAPQPNYPSNGIFLVVRFRVVNSWGASELILERMLSQFSPGFKNSKIHMRVACLGRPV